MSGKSPPFGINPLALFRRKGVQWVEESALFYKVGTVLAYAPLAEEDESAMWDLIGSLGNELFKWPFVPAGKRTTLTNSILEKFGVEPLDTTKWSSAKLFRMQNCVVQFINEIWFDEQVRDRFREHFEPCDRLRVIQTDINEQLQELETSRERALRAAHLVRKWRMVEAGVKGSVSSAGRKESKG